VTTANPVGGTFGGPITVSLGANEAATIYYCTAAVRAHPGGLLAALAISTNTTLRYYAQDSAGNKEAIKIHENYTINNRRVVHAVSAWGQRVQDVSNLPRGQGGGRFRNRAYTVGGIGSRMVNGPASRGKISARGQCVLLMSWELRRVQQLPCGAWRQRF